MCHYSKAVADMYAGWLGDGISIVTPNKKAGPGGLRHSRHLRRIDSRDEGLNCTRVTHTAYSAPRLYEKANSGDTKRYQECLAAAKVRSGVQVDCV